MCASLGAYFFSKKLISLSLHRLIVTIILKSQGSYENNIKKPSVSEVSDGGREGKIPKKLG